jgi:hypothetical protein
MQEVTDPNLITQLENQSNKVVTDPSLIAKLDGISGLDDIHNSAKNTPTFMQGLKAGALDQPEPQTEHWYSPASVGHFVGESALPTAGAVFAGPAGAMAGEATKKAIGRAYEAVEGLPSKDESALRTVGDVASSAALQKAGDVAGPMIGKGISKAGEAIGGVTDWLSSKIGKSFLKASKAINSYGHEPEKAITDEGIVAHSWDDLIDKAKAAKHDLGEMYDDFFSSHKADTIVNADEVTKPIDTALSEANKFPNENKTLISRLEGLKNDVLSQIDKESQAGQGLDIKRANDIKKSLYKVTKYSGNNSDDIPLNKVKQEVAGALASKIEDVSPEISTLNQRYANVTALQNAAINRAVVASRSDIVGIPEIAAGGFLLHGNAPAAVATEIGGRVLKTPLGATPTMNALKGVGKAAETVAPVIGKAAESVASKSGAALIPAVEKKNQ